MDFPSEVSSTDQLAYFSFYDGHITKGKLCTMVLILCLRKWTNSWTIIYSECSRSSSDRISSGLLKATYHFFHFVNHKERNRFCSFVEHVDTKEGVGYEKSSWPCYIISEANIPSRITSLITQIMREPLWRFI